MSEELREMNVAIVGDAPMVEYDGVAEFWFDSLEDWKKLWADEEFAASLDGKSS